VSECAQIIDVLKRSLKTRGLTYKDLAKRLDLSESSVKRVFAAETFTLERLENICAAIGMTVTELVQMSARSNEARSTLLTVEQEELLAGDSRVLACFYLLLNGHSSAEIAERLELNEREQRAMYVKLDAARLIELQPRLKARLRVGPVVTWRGDGPMYRRYEQQVKAEFLNADFQGTEAALHFRSAELSEASARILIRKLDRLAQEFAEFAALDVHLPAKDKRSVALMMAFRPWVFSMFEGLRR
jgi:DNA-binding Xre family transcriptional regulator